MTTRDLGITPSTTSGNLTPQETATQEAGTVGADGAGLSCAGSRVVAETRQDSKLNSLIKSPAENLTQVTQEEEFPANGDDL